MYTEAEMHVQFILLVEEGDSRQELSPDEPPGLFGALVSEYSNMSPDMITPQSALNTDCNPIHWASKSQSSALCSTVTDIKPIGIRKWPADHHIITSACIHVGTSVDITTALSHRRRSVLGLRRLDTTASTITALNAIVCTQAVIHALISRAAAASNRDVGIGWSRCVGGFGRRLCGWIGTTDGPVPIIPVRTVRILNAVRVAGVLEIWVPLEARVEAKEARAADSAASAGAKWLGWTRPEVNRRWLQWGRDRTGLFSILPFCFQVMATRQNERFSPTLAVPNHFVWICGSCIGSRLSAVCQLPDSPPHTCGCV